MCAFYMSKLVNSTPARVHCSLSVILVKLRISLITSDLRWKKLSTTTTTNGRVLVYVGCCLAAGKAGWVVKRQETDANELLMSEWAVPGEAFGHNRSRSYRFHVFPPVGYMFVMFRGFLH
jgi:hypothetical protein